MPRRKCCCNGCENSLPSDLHCCCNCICDAICVTITIYGDADCDCDEVSVQFNYDCTTDSYHGDINCRGLIVDLEFVVKQCDEYDGCYICLLSDCLGMPYGTCPEDCQEFSPGRAFCRGDYNGRVRTGGFAATWDDVDFSGCGDVYCGTGTIDIACVERVYASCKGDCGEPLCDNCDCFCRCLCINYIDDDCNEIVEACWDDGVGGWEATIVCPYETIEITLTVVKNEYTGDCELQLSTSILPVDPDPVPFTCPGVSASWTIEKQDESEATISVTCRVCGECGVPIPCCPDPIPATLTATVSGSCACGDGTMVSIVFDREDRWGGQADFGTCGSIIKVDLLCVGQGPGAFKLLLTWLDGDGPLGCLEVFELNPDVSSCEPFSLEWNNLQLPGCCEIPPATPPKVINLVITA